MMMGGGMEIDRRSSPGRQMGYGGGHQGHQGHYQGHPMNGGRMDNGYNGYPKRYPVKRVDGEIGLKILLPNNVVGSLMGPGGTSLKSLKSAVASKIYISENRYPGTDLRCVYLLGDGQSVNDCQKRILSLVAENIWGKKSKTDIWDANTIDYQLYAEIEIEIKISIPQQCAGMLLGKSGATLTSIQEESQVNLLFMTGKDDPSTHITHERVVTIKGECSKCTHCVKMIIDKFSVSSDLAQYVFGSNFSASATNAVANQQHQAAMAINSNPRPGPGGIASISALNTANAVAAAAAAQAQAEAAAQNITAIPQGNNPSLVNQGLAQNPYSSHNSNINLNLNGNSNDNGDLSMGASLHLDPSQDDGNASFNTGSLLNLVGDDGNQQNNTRGIFEGLGLGLSPSNNSMPGNGSPNPLYMNNRRGLSANSMLDLNSSNGSSNDLNSSGGSLTGFEDGGLIELSTTTKIELAVHDNYVGNIIGPARQTLVDISNVTGSQVTVTPRSDIPQPHHRRLVIEGSNKAAMTAYNLIKHKVNQAKLAGL